MMEEHSYSQYNVAGDGQKTSLTSLLSALKDLDTNNEAGLDDITKGLGDTLTALEVIAAKAHSRSDHHDYSHHGGYSQHSLRHGNYTTAPVYEFKDVSTVNLEPWQAGNNQSGISTSSNSLSSDENNNDTRNNNNHNDISHSP